MPPRSTTHLKTDHVHTFISAIPGLSTGGPAASSSSTN